MSRCVFSLEARADLLHIHDYIAQDSPANALLFVDRLEEQCLRLADYPWIGVAHPEFGSDHRSFVVPGTRYLIIYRPTAMAWRSSTYVTGARTFAACSSNSRRPAATIESIGFLRAAVGGGPDC